jgi:hypothetical protein
MKRYSTIALAVALAVVGCKDNNATNPIDAPTVDALSGGLTRTSLQQLATGVTAQDRAAYATTTVLILSEILARDVYRIDASEPRFVTETLGGNPDPGSFSGSGGYAAFYTAARSANTILLSLGSGASTQFTAGEVNAARGFFRTMKALDYYRVLELRDTVGISIQSDDPQEVTAVRCKTAVLAYIAALLDSANTDLTNAAGASLPFKLPTGFTAFGRDHSTAANLIRLNRGLKGKVDFYRGLDRTSPQPALFATAIAELTAALGAGPGAVPQTQLATGAYYKFDPAEISNPRSDSKVGLNPLVADSISGSSVPATHVGDTRASKIVSRPNGTMSFGSPPANGISTSVTYSGAVASAANQILPIAILKDEELVLLRAQAEIEAGQLANAAADNNTIRAAYGLAAIPTFADKASAIFETLYNKRYSLLFEGPQRLVDVRGYGRLNNTYLRKELPADPFSAAFPLPKAELDARGLTTNPACTP